MKNSIRYITLNCKEIQILINNTSTSGRLAVSTHARNSGNRDRNLLYEERRSIKNMIYEKSEL